MAITDHTSHEYTMIYWWDLAELCMMAHVIDDVLCFHEAASLGILVDSG